MAAETWEFDLCVVGGCGRVGLPLAVVFANQGLRVAIHDISQAAVDSLSTGKLPFQEPGLQALVERVLGKNLRVANDPGQIERSRCVIVVTGTPVDEHLNPRWTALSTVLETLLGHFRDGQLLVLRSTVYPGTTERVARLFAQRGKGGVHVAFCPERIAEGKAVEELQSLPQIVAGVTPEAVRLSRELFSALTEEIVELSPFEAELAKLFTNSWRYIQFSVANQFYMMAQAGGADFYRIYDAIRYKYPRTQGFPRAGFVAGPCLFKDTLQLAALSNNNFFLGHAAMLINEGLPNFLIGQLKARGDLSASVVGVLGMAFKGDSDDPRESLSYKLRNLLRFEAAEVLCSDPYVVDPSFVSPEELKRRCQVVVLGAPHSCYRELTFPDNVHLIDVWGFFESQKAH